MFDKFELMSVRFDALVTEVNEPGVSPLFRWQGFLRFAAEVLRFFERHPTLQSVKLLSVVRPEINLEKNVDVRLRHHLKLTTEGADIGLSRQEDTDDYVSTALPYHTMGAGVFDIRRDSPWVQQYLAFSGHEEEEAAYLAVLNDLATNVDLAFGLVQVHHDLGLASAG